MFNQKSFEIYDRIYRPTVLPCTLVLRSSSSLYRFNSHGRNIQSTKSRFYEKWRLTSSTFRVLLSSCRTLVTIASRFSLLHRDSTRRIAAIDGLAERRGFPSGLKGAARTEEHKSEFHSPLTRRNTINKCRYPGVFFFSRRSCYSSRGSGNIRGHAYSKGLTSL